jgi:site-specific recombinase XerD
MPCPLTTIQPVFTDAEQLALAGYRGLTREAYTLDLRQFTTWCRTRSLNLFAVHRADIESSAPGPGSHGPSRATVTRRLCTIAGYRYAVEQELLEHSPTAYVRRLQLISLLALNGMRVSEATGADIEHLGLVRGHRTPTITRKGGKVVTIPLAPRTARAIDLAVGERTGWPVFLAADSAAAGPAQRRRIVRKTARRAGIAKAVTPHTLRHAFITAVLDAGVPLRDVQEAASQQFVLQDELPVIPTRQPIRRPQWSLTATSTRT